MHILQEFLRIFRQCRRTGNRLTSSCPHKSRRGSLRRSGPHEFRRRGQNLRGLHRLVPVTSAFVRPKYPAGLGGVLQAWLVELVKVCSRPVTGHDGGQIATRCCRSKFCRPVIPVATLLRHRGWQQARRSCKTPGHLCSPATRLWSRRIAD